jgi:HEAT repeat protein
MSVDTPEARDLLRDVVKTGDPQVRVAAIYSLARDSDPESIELMLDLSKDKDPQVRSAALGALAQNGSPQAVDGVLDAAQGRDTDTRVQAISMLGNFDDPRASQALEQAINDDDPQVAQTAISTAQYALGDEADQLFMSRMMDPRAPKEVRMAAAYAVRQRGLTLSPDQDKQVTDLIGADDGMGGGYYGGRGEFFLEEG